ncbi:hypothetical protein AB1Y20_001388 [Prymnesium parvum]|uniref:MCM10 OB-fold domain-containing protein n=1 Tax=Prymnesium parvum TaxID=97485 RepID=A0AB34KBW5_PRYPA
MHQADVGVQASSMDSLMQELGEDEETVKMSDGGLVGEASLMDALEEELDEGDAGRGMEGGVPTGKDAEGRMPAGGRIEDGMPATVGSASHTTALMQGLVNTDDLLIAHRNEAAASVMHTLPRELGDHGRLGGSSFIPNDDCGAASSGSAGDTRGLNEVDSNANEAQQEEHEPTEEQMDASELFGSCSEDDMEPSKEQDANDVASLIPKRATTIDEWQSRSFPGGVRTTSSERSHPTPKQRAQPSTARGSGLSLSSARILPAAHAASGDRSSGSSKPHRPREVERISGISLSRRHLSQRALDELLENSHCRVLTLQQAKAHAGAQGHWATIGVVAQYAPGSMKGARANKYHKWVLTDLHPTTPSTISVLHFGEKCEKVCIGDVRVLMAPKLLTGEGTSTLGLACTVKSLEQLVLVGQADRVCPCRHTGPDGVRCTTLIHRESTDYCSVHLHAAMRAPPTTRLDLAAAAPVPGAAMTRTKPGLPPAARRSPITSHPQRAKPVPLGLREGGVGCRASGSNASLKAAGCVRNRDRHDPRDDGKANAESAAVDAESRRAETHVDQSARKNPHQELRSEFLKRQQSAGARNLVQYASNLHKHQEERRRLEEERRKRQRLLDEKATKQQAQRQGQRPPLRSRPGDRAHTQMPTSNPNQATSSSSKPSLSASPARAGLSADSDDEEELLIVDETPAETHLQDRESNDWKRFLYAGRKLPQSAAPHQSTLSYSAPPANVVTKVFGAVQSKEEREALVRHMQVIKHGIAFGKTADLEATES